MASVPRVREGLTLDEFLRMPDIDARPYLEYIDGTVVPRMSPQYKHGRLTKGFLYALDAAADERGEAIPKLRCNFAGRSIVPDVAFMLSDHVPLDDQGEPADWIARPPDIHIEIVSPKQGMAEADEKLRHSTSHGCPLGWLVHPYRRTIDEYRPGQPPRRLPPDGVLEGEPVLPGFRLPVAEVFGWLKRK